LRSDPVASGVGSFDRHWGNDAASTNIFHSLLAGNTPMRADLLSSMRSEIEKQSIKSEIWELNKS
jgi:hypothetical protein